MVLEYKGRRWYLLFEPYSATWVRMDKNSDVLSSDQLPFISSSLSGFVDSFFPSSCSSSLIFFFSNFGLSCSIFSIVSNICFLSVSRALSLPVDVVTQTMAILAKRRAGKSYTMRKITEQLFEAQQQVILVDPKGDQWGIRSSADGKKAGYPIVILGGEHADVPLEVSSGETVAKLVVEETVSGDGAQMQ